jgi:hypothetical protein
VLKVLCTEQWLEAFVLNMWFVTPIAPPYTQTVRKIDADDGKTFSCRKRIALSPDMILGG